MWNRYRLLVYCFQQNNKRFWIIRNIIKLSLSLKTSTSLKKFKKIIEIKHLPSSHTSPNHPSGQSQRKDPNRFLHVPPLRQALASRHSSTSEGIKVCISLTIHPFDIFRKSMNSCVFFSPEQLFVNSCLSVTLNFDMTYIKSEIFNSIFSTRLCLNIDPYLFDKYRLSILVGSRICKNHSNSYRSRHVNTRF